MKVRIKPPALAVALCLALASLTHATAAVQSAPSPSRQAYLEAQQLLKERNEAKPIAKAAETKLREAGLDPGSLGFGSARAIRDRQAESGSRLAAYAGYVKTTKELEKKIRNEVTRGVQPVISQDIARFERLQAEVDLARIAGRLPAREE